MEENRIYNMDCLAGMRQLPAHCADLIIADPPYYKVKGDFDKAWGCDFGAYLADCEAWADEMERVLAYNGTLIWYGDYRRIAYMQTMLDKRFHLLSNCVMEKVNSVQNKKASLDRARTFFVNEERFLVYASASTEGEDCQAQHKYRYACGLAKSEAYKPLISYFRNGLKASGKTTGDVNRALKTAMAGHWFTDKSQWELPTASNYERLKEFAGAEHFPRPHEELRKEYEELRKEYEELRKEYEELRRPFRMEQRQSDIFRVISQGATTTKKYGHATPKPVKLTKDLIKATTKEGALVVVPFVGSGTECVCANQLRRRFIGFELDPTYAANASERVRMECQLDLFV